MRLIRNRNFLIMWIGQLATIFGNRFSEIAIPLIVLQFTGSPWQAALVVVCSQIIPLILALPVGSWVETRSKKNIAMMAEIVSFLTMSLLVVFVWLELLNMWVLAAGLLIMGATGLFYRVSFGAMVPMVVGRKNLVSAHSYFEGADAISTFLGPVMAGVVLSTLGVAAVLSVDAMTYFISFLGIAFLSVKESRKREETKTKTTYLSSFQDISYLFANGYQRFVSFNQCILSFCTTAVTLTVIVYTSQTLSLSEWQTGLVLSSAGAGNMIGVFLLHRVKDFSWNNLYAVLMLVSGVGLFLILLTGYLPLIMLGMFIFDGALSMAFVVNGSARQSITPDHFLARIGGGAILISGIVAISGNLFSGGVSELLMPQAIIAFCGFLLLVASLVSLLFKQGNKRIQELVPIELEESLTK
ncbi:MFS transporter [Ornithinibacillus massiliensis]|uniref:MFS transporter n=1 Tax=Ornithinibacillus massiliensis TaxID=1944633 RepID=A0ABS5M9C7_9BACI|nr:MFS transporter [Ornithinibacillus massiliensis]MBS3678727.1 MFS transporter [Ornithinibacillus massiliensis]